MNARLNSRIFLRRSALVTGLTATGAVIAFFATASSQAGAPVTPQQASLALAIAHQQANSTIPAPATSGATAQEAPASDTAWPTNVDSVSYSLSTRQAAVNYLDGSQALDDRPVLVIRMTGDFSVLRAGPSGAPSSASGKLMTIVIDAASGDVLDFGMDPSSDALPEMPNSVDAFSR